MYRLHNSGDLFRLKGGWGQQVLLSHVILFFLNISKMTLPILAWPIKHVRSNLALTNFWSDFGLIITLILAVVHNSMQVQAPFPGLSEAPAYSWNLSLTSVWIGVHRKVYLRFCFHHLVKRQLPPRNNDLTLGNDDLRKRRSCNREQEAKRGNGWLMRIVTERLYWSQVLDDIGFLSLYLYNKRQ